MYQISTQRSSTANVHLLHNPNHQHNHCHDAHAVINARLKQRTAHTIRNGIHANVHNAVRHDQTHPTAAPMLRQLAKSLDRWTKATPTTSMCIQSHSKLTNARNATTPHPNMICLPCNSAGLRKTGYCNNGTMRAQTCISKILHLAMTPGALPNANPLNAANAEITRFAAATRTGDLPRFTPVSHLKPPTQQDNMRMTPWENRGWKETLRIPTHPHAITQGMTMTEFSHMFQRCLSRLHVELESELHRQIRNLPMGKQDAGVCCNNTPASPERNFIRKLIQNF